MTVFLKLQIITISYIKKTSRLMYPRSQLYGKVTKKLNFYETRPFLIKILSFYNMHSPQSIFKISELKNLTIREATSYCPNFFSSHSL